MQMNVFAVLKLGFGCETDVVVAQAKYHYRKFENTEGRNECRFLVVFGIHRYLMVSSFDIYLRINLRADQVMSSNVLDLRERIFIRERMDSAQLGSLCIHISLGKPSAIVLPARQRISRSSCDGRLLDLRLSKPIAP